MIIACTECGKQYQLPEEKTGAKFRCSQCRAVIDTSNPATHADVAEAPVASGPAKATANTTSEKEHYLISAKGHLLLPKDREFVFGRALQSDYLLDDSRASRRHSRLMWNGAAFLLNDLDSRNGTFYKGEPLAEAVPLRDGDTFQIANEEFSYRSVNSFDELRKEMHESRRYNRMKDTEELQAVENMLPSNDFNGSLNTMGTTEICQILKLGHRTGRLFIMDDDHAKCLLYFEDGDIVSAEYGHHRGDEAVLSACKIRKGVFSFQTRFRCKKPNVKRSTEYLLLEAARQKDEHD